MTSLTRVACVLGAIGAHAALPAAASDQSLALAAKAAQAQSSAAQEFRVTSTRLDPATGQLVVVGTGFRPGVEVVLNGGRLRVLSLLSHEIRAELPTLLPGSYRLEVEQRRGGTQRFVVTLGLGGTGTGTGTPGPAGPQGPQGPMGPQGPAGAQGLRGVAGPAGANGAAGPQGPQGLQGVAGPAGSSGGLTVVASNGAVLGTLMTLGMGGQPSVVALQDNGVWLVAPVNPEGIAPMSFPALYLDAACATTPYIPFDTNSTPLMRLLQTVNAGDATAYYSGNPTGPQVFSYMSPLGQQTPCQTTTGTGWDQSVLAGPLQRFDLTRFPAPFRIQ
jgi:Collagen triple helix repeat (20 copies)